jgi:hypothetical protein
MMKKRKRKRKKKKKSLKNLARIKNQEKNN